jgi:hypothetical protein
MTPSTLPPPTRPEAGADEASARPPRRAPLTASPQHNPTGRVTRKALVLSLVAHVVLGLVVLLAPVVRPRRAAPPPPRDSVQYLDIAAFPSGDQAADAGAALQQPGGAPEAAAPARDTATARGAAPALSFPTRVPAGVAPVAGGEGQQPDAGVGGVGPPGGAGAGRAGAAGGRLGAQYGDARLAAPTPRQVEREPTEHERYERRLEGRLGAINDSVADEAERRRRQRNWTIRDRNGREWGFGEGGTTVIAGRRLPLPLPLPVVQRDRDADNAERERLRRYQEIQDQAEVYDRHHEQRRRADETRRRVDNDRRRRRAEAVTDTTRRSQ